MKPSIGPFVAALVLGALAGPPGLADEEPATPPSITYPGSRESKAWIETPGGTRVAVGEGVEWHGVKVYISLTWDLVGVDVQTGKTLYAQSIGAFWNALGFKEVTPKGGEKVWAVELRPGSRARRGADRRQYHDLRTGKKLEIPGLVETPSGTPFEPRANWYGDKSAIGESFSLVVSTAANWAAVQERMFGAVDPERFGPIDFENEVVFVLSTGNGWNCNGHDVAAAYEDDARILLRTHRRSFQTIGGGQKVRAWGVYVLPRRPAKAYVFERNAQNLIGGPALWKTIWKLDRLRAPGDELARLPKRSPEPHHGWDGQDERPPPLPPPRPPRKDR